VLIFVARRVLAVVPVLFGVTLAVFSMLFLRTRMTSRLRPETAEGARQRAVLKRAASVDDVADQVVAFCRSDSVTGQVLNIDAGVFFH
jgi:enoyl-[acyl-carrier-protein] reductase (NADH)